MFYKKSKGFTLIELLVVIAIIGILATIVLVSLNTARQKARDVRRIGDLRQVALALEMYYDDNTSTGYPGDSDAVACNDWAAMESAIESGGYMTEVPLDPGTNTYTYEADAAHANYVLRAQVEGAVPAGDVDGTVFGCNCADADTNGFYCIKP